MLQKVRGVVPLRLVSAVAGVALGLGLAIVQKICEVYDFKLHYTYQNHLHCIRVGFTAGQS